MPKRNPIYMYKGCPKTGAHSLWTDLKRHWYWFLDNIFGCRLDHLPSCLDCMGRMLKRSLM